MLSLASFGNKPTGDAHEHGVGAHRRDCVAIQLFHTRIGCRTVGASGETRVATFPQQMHVLRVEMGSLVL